MLQRISSCGTPAASGQGSRAVLACMDIYRKNQNRSSCVFMPKYVRCLTTPGTTTSSDTLSSSPKDGFPFPLTSSSSSASLQPTPITVFTDDEVMIRDTVRQWAREKLKPLVRQMDDEGCIQRSVIDDLFHQGYMGVEIPTQYTGGSGLSFTSTCLIVEEIARVDPSVAIMVDIHNTLTINAIRFWGSQALQQTWLPRLASNTVSSFCLSEADSGSDAFALKMTATPSPDQSYFMLNGTKLWISNAQEAGVFLVFANVNPNVGYKGITAFMLDATTEGITIGKPENKLGLRASSTCPLMFDNVKVDATNILGEVGLGYKYCINILNEGRIGIAAQQLGIAKACLYDIALPYMAERKQFNQPIGTFQGMQHQYAFAATEIHAAEVMIYNACRLKEANLPFVKEASMCKFYAARVAESTASKTIEWLGGIGFTKDLFAEKFFRDCKVGSIYEGTSNIQLQTIAKQLLADYT
jgi:short-chain 2-methylacyl-CoA dehydrogenase